MSASTSRSYSTSSSGPTTPWLSPIATTEKWRDGFPHMDGRKKGSSRTSIDAGDLRRSSSLKIMPDRHSQEWWEHVLPPGQLAERLRKAQRSTNLSRRKTNPALANATPSERSAWKRLSGIPKEGGSSARSDASVASSRRASAWSATSMQSNSSHSSSLRTDDSASNSHQVSSAEVSSDEYASPPGARSPLHYTHNFPGSVCGLFESKSMPGSRSGSTQHSPEQAQVPWPISAASSSSSFCTAGTTTRSTSHRRSRVLSEDGTASSTYSVPQASNTLPRSFTASQIKRLNKGQFVSHSLPDTPEISSDENSDGRSSVTTTTTQHTRRVSITRTTVRASSQLASPPTILRTNFDQPDQPALPVDDESKDAGEHSRRNRHVSFDAVNESINFSQQNPSHETMTGSQSAFNFSTLPGREYCSPFDSLPPRSNSTRRTRQGARINGRKATSFSLPGSRRGSIHEDMPFLASHKANASSATDSNATKDARFAHRRTTSVPDAALLESLNVAQKQLASAGNLALTLTRQLSAPLRPVFHATLFLSISSITVVSLACFLCASYLLTAWDDVSKRSHRVGEVAGKTKHKVETTFNWGIRMLGTDEDGKRSRKFNAAPSTSQSNGGKSPNSSSSSNDSAKPYDTTGKAAESASSPPRDTKGHAIFWPVRMAWSGAGLIAHRVTPSPVANMFRSQDDSHRSGNAKTNTSKPTFASSSNFPPRPPLSTLLPSIMFTLVLALGAGLASFFAARRAAAEAGTTSSTGGPAASNSSAKDAHGCARPSSVPESGPSMAYVHFPSASASPYIGRSHADKQRFRRSVPVC